MDLPYPLTDYNLGFMTGWMVFTKSGRGVAMKLLSAPKYVRFGTAASSVGLAEVGSAAMVGAASVALGAAIGATVGTGIGYAMHGDKGARDALDLYSGKVSPTQYYQTVRSAIF